jgi:hypothetical protein
MIERCWYCRWLQFAKLLLCVTGMLAVKISVPKERCSFTRPPGLAREVRLGAESFATTLT